MSYYLIGIGGTGAKCLEAFVHLCGAGLLKDTQPVKMVFVDADVSCGNLQRTQIAVNLYNKAKEVGFGDTDLFKNVIDSFEPWTPVPEGRSTMDDVFQRNILTSKKEYQKLGLLYDALFTEQERGTPLDKGFRGHPTIGAAVMSQAMDTENDKMWQKFKQQINSDKDAKIFLFASVFGGTGAAGFPTIASILEKTLQKNTDSASVAKIGGALILPYFQFPPAPTDEEKEMQANVSEFMLNTKAALNYYNSSNLLENVFKAIYLVGDNDLTEMQEFSLGSNTQKNNAHFIEIYAALAAFDFFNKYDSEKATAPMIAREDDTPETQDKIMWEDIPNVCVNGNVKDKLSAFVRFLYVYKNCILANLQKCAHDQNEKKLVAWYKDLVEKVGKIDVYNDSKTMEAFEALGEYTEAYFSWWEQIIKENKKRKIVLLNREIWNDSLWEDNQLDVYQVVLPIKERKDKLTYKKFWGKLCDYTHKMRKTNDSGAEILMRAVYELCNE